MKPGDRVTWRDARWVLVRRRKDLGRGWWFVQRRSQDAPTGWLGQVAQESEFRDAERLQFQVGDAVHVGSARRPATVVSVGPPLIVEHPPEVRVSPEGARWLHEAHTSTPAPHLVNV